MKRYPYTTAAMRIQGRTPVITSGCRFEPMPDRLIVRMERTLAPVGRWLRAH